jgi:hypothetical protein
MSKIVSLALAFAGTIAVTSAPIRAEDYVQVGVGVDYSKGNYGDPIDTEMLAVPVTTKVQMGNFFASAALPWVRVEGPDNVIPGDGGITPGIGTGALTTRKGVGDLILSAGYSLPLADATFFDLTGKVKLPTADEDKFLGTGTTDYTLQGELLHSFGPLSIAARGGRRFNGSNHTFPLRDVWQAGAGAYYQTGLMTVGLDYDWREGSLSTSPDRSEATASLTYKLNDGLRLQGYGYTGFSDGSPDLGGGLQVLYRFGM